MAKKIFLDTNIIIDYLIEDRTKHLVAKELISYCFDLVFQGCISETVITNTAYVLRKVLNQKQLNFVFSGFCEYLKVLPTRTKSVISACEINKDDLEDAILYQIALENNCTHFITSNYKDFLAIGDPKVKVISPDAFLAEHTFNPEI